ncbi:uncharacterized protein ACLA_078240 [Aspergillus clavatus NRRL 1]|uniref:S-adenosyl-L-methionine-dependent methyltransferase n=1 Tax=Aspergillus clavatus (strain ATCC 1007 / CBS 513.65 / DSM 816 / NCTC 3887 / NRRL 1 / QM 1276 / 107) TaxID=344612 RepID=A1CLU7_ASPCL|nr:uncharacterized protein ACLA_078240 [Aspergillus clavatus NRRL 1]EAW09076.1 conserved hypothetical protein [Aspergillus clavatus NRRL 1]
MTNDTKFTTMLGAGAYNANSSLQLKAVEACFKLLPITKPHLNSEIITIVDYGCAEGFNSIIFLEKLVEMFSLPSSLSIIFNDTPANDFNSLASTLYASSLVTTDRVGPRIMPSFVPMSYLEQVQPTNSVDIGLCLTSLNWLSCFQSIRSSPLSEAQVSAVAKQDLSTFLGARYQEFHPGGNLILSIPIDGEMTLKAVHRALERAIHTTFGQSVAAAYQCPSYFRQSEEISSVLQAFTSKWRVISQFEQNIEHPASAQFRASLMEGPDQPSQAALQACVKAICSFILAVFGPTIINTARAFGETSADGKTQTNQELLEMIADAYQEELLQVDWRRPVGCRFSLLKLQRV